MSKRVAIAAIALLAFGGVMIPGGFLVNDFIKDLTYSSVDEGLLGIKYQGIPIVIESLHDIGPASALAIIKEKGAQASSLLANATMWMGHINVVEISVGLFPWVENLYWNVVEEMGESFTVYTEPNFPAIMGIAEWFGSDLNFSTYDLITYKDIGGGVQRLKYGVNTSGTGMWWGDRLPGIFEDTYERLGDGEWPPDNITDSWQNKVDKKQDRGFGVIKLLELIEIANDIEIALLCGENGYNLTNPEQKFEYNGEYYTKLEILYYYLTDYFFIDGIPLIIPHFNNLVKPLSNFYPQYKPCDWNGYDTSYEDITTYSIVEQWVKCISYDDGADLHDSEPLIAEGTYGLEPGGPGRSSGIPMQAALQLWNETNEYSLANFPKGIQKWADAFHGDEDAYDELLAEFSQYPGYDDGYWNENYTYGEADWGFNETDMDLILDWLYGNGGGWSQGSFSEYLLPILIIANYNKTIEEFALHVLMELWVNGTVMGYPLYPEGFPLPLGFADIKGFEIGYQAETNTVIPTNMSLDSALALWDASSEYSLVSPEGLQLWLAAADNNYVAYLKVKIAIGLTDEQMVLLLAWLPDFQKNVMPYLAQYQYSLPADSITLGNIVQVAGIGIGGACLGLGALGVVGTIRAKRKPVKTKSKSKKLNPFELGS